MTTSKHAWFITGASSGFGRALAEHVLAQGGQVAATARDPAYLADLEGRWPGRALALALDVTDDASVTAAAAAAEARFGGIGVLVNNAGHGLVAGVEEASDAEVQELFGTNVFGLLRVTRAVLPAMRRRRSGHIVNLGSVGGLVAIAGSGLYCASKFAVEGISEAMRIELAPLGIGVTVVEPGGFRTDFAGRSMATAGQVIPDYAETVGKWRTDIVAMDGHQPGDPTRAVAAIWEAVAADRPPFHLVLGTAALNRVRAKLGGVLEELDRWEAVSRSTELAPAA